MIWLAWRQFRVNLLAVYAALAVVAVLLLITGPNVADLYRTTGAEFFDALNTDRGNQRNYAIGILAMYVLPAIIGVFWGAPLVARDLETGTHRLVWNQSITRTRWLATKLLVVGVAAAVAGTLSLAVTWWSDPIDKAVNQGYQGGEFFSQPRLSAELFGARGIVPIGYTVLAFVIGVTVGLLLRRTVAAMAVTLVAVVAVQIATPLLIQPNLLKPEVLTTTIQEGGIRSLSASEDGVIQRISVAIDEPGAWVHSSRTIDAAGNTVTSYPAWLDGCMRPGGPRGAKTPQTDACFERLAAEGYRQQFEYLPANRYWTLQWLETGVLVGVALLMSGFCFWWIRRRIS